MRRSTGITFVALTLTLSAVGIVWTGQTATPSTPSRQTQHQPAAQVAPQPRQASPAVIDAIAGLPDDLDLIVVVDKAAELRQSVVGLQALKFVSESGSLVDVQRAWTALATQLGWSESDAFDRLLGTRVVLASRAVGDSDRRWAILSDVSAETERRLRDRLNVAPRGLSKGHQILSVENGEFELTTHRQTRGKPGGNQRQAAPADNDTYTIVFGPAGRGELFDDLIGTLSNGEAAAPMRQRDAFARMADMGPADVLVMTSTSVSNRNSGEGAWQDFVILTGSRETVADAPSGTAWRAGVLVRDRSQQAALQAMPVTSASAFDALAGGALAAVVQNAPLPKAIGFGFSGVSVLSALPVPEDAKPLLTQRQAVALRLIGCDERMSCSVALHTNAPGRLAGVMDAALARGMRTFEQRMNVQPKEASTPQVEPPDYGGISPEAVRVAPLPATGVPPMNVLTARPLVLSWVYATRPGVNGPFNTLQRTCAAEQLATPALMTPSLDNGVPGWMIINASQEPCATTGCDPIAASRAGDADTHAVIAPSEICLRKGPTPAEIVRNDANALTTNAEGGVAPERWFLLADVKPAAIELRLPAMFPDIRGIRSIMRRLDTFSLRIKATDEGDLSGEMRIRLAAEKP